MDTNSFIQEIIAHPHDEQLRLVFADYLEEREDPRGELIRVQLERAAVPMWDPRRIDLAYRERVAQRQTGYAFFGHLPDERPPLCSDGGFYSGVALSVSAFLKLRNRLFRQSPITTLKLEGRTNRLQQLANTEQLRQVHHLTFAVDSPPAEFVRFFSSAYLSELRSLHLKFRPNSSHDPHELTAACLRSVNTDRLTKLTIADSFATGSEVNTLLNAVPFPQLTVLETGRCRYFDASLADLARSDAISQLKSLQIGGTFTNAGLQDFQHTAVCRELARLHVNNPQLTAAAFDAAVTFSHLRWLSLEMGLDDTQLQPVIERFPAIEVLEVPGNALEDTAAIWLAESAFYPQLRRLDLTGNSIGLPGAEALAFEHNGTTEVLLADNDVSREDLRSLQQRSGGSFGGIRQ